MVNSEVTPGPALTIPYQEAFRERLRSVLGGVGPVAEVEGELTRLHADAVEQFVARHPETRIDIIGLHGHTILHRPAERRTWQLGDGALLANILGLDVVADFRSADVAAGGEGAPLAPLFHTALAAALPKPLAILNIGGVANVTWIGEDAEVLAFDTGPGNALIDDWVRQHIGAAADIDGAFARAGSRIGGARRTISGIPLLRAPAAKIARSRRFPRNYTRWPFVPGRRRHADRDDRRRCRGRDSTFPSAGAGMAGMRRRQA